MSNLCFLYKLLFLLLILCETKSAPLKTPVLLAECRGTDINAVGCCGEQKQQHNEDLGNTKLNKENRKHKYKCCSRQIGQWTPVDKEEENSKFCSFAIKGVLRDLSLGQTMFEKLIEAANSLKKKKSNLANSYMESYKQHEIIEKQKDNKNKLLENQLKREKQQLTADIFQTESEEKNLNRILKSIEKTTTFINTIKSFDATEMKDLEDLKKNLKEKEGKLESCRKLGKIKERQLKDLTKRISNFNMFIEEQETKLKNAEMAHKKEMEEIKKKLDKAMTQEKEVKSKIAKIKTQEKEIRKESKKCAELVEKLQEQVASSTEQVTSRKVTTEKEGVAFLELTSSKAGCDKLCKIMQTFENERFLQDNNFYEMTKEFNSRNIINIRDILLRLDYYIKTLQTLKSEQYRFHEDLLNQLIGANKNLNTSLTNVKELRAQKSNSLQDFKKQIKNYEDDLVKIVKKKEKLDDKKVKNYKEHIKNMKLLQSEKSNIEMSLNECNSANVAKKTKFDNKEKILKEKNASIRKLMKRQTEEDEKNKEEQKKGLATLETLKENREELQKESDLASFLLKDAKSEYEGNKVAYNELVALSEKHEKLYDIKQNAFYKPVMSSTKYIKAGPNAFIFVDDNVQELDRKKITVKVFDENGKELENVEGDTRRKLCGLDEQLAFTQHHDKSGYVFSFDCHKFSCHKKNSMCTCLHALSKKNANFVKVTYEIEHEEGSYVLSLENDKEEGLIKYNLQKMQNGKTEKALEASVNGGIPRDGAEEDDTERRRRRRLLHWGGNCC